MKEEGTLAGNEGGSNSWLPTPSLVNSREELASLVAQQQRDESLKDSWRKAKDLYDLNTQPRQLEPGELALCHTPGLTSKLHGICEGSFEVLAKMSECNHVISVPGKRYTKQTVHINRLKKWVESKGNLFRVVVADEERYMSQLVNYGWEPLTCLRHNRVSLDEVLVEYPDRVTTDLGVAKNEIAEILV